VLQEFSKRVGAGLPRESDWFARMGGEEFVVVLPQTALNGAQIVAEKLRAGIAATPVRTLAGAVRITVSIGVASLDAFAVTQTPPSLDSMLDLADRCLYESKNAGRNRVTVPPSAG
jgi:diguanylate cyclase (GGDEF)-like protein